MRNRRWLLLAVLLYVLSFGASVAIRSTASDPVYASDIGRLMNARIHKVVDIYETADVVRALQQARNQGLPISMSGTKHSQGGHSFTNGAIVLNMKPYNRILHLDIAKRLIRVQSGATWADVQEAVHPHGLSIRIMQSSNIFTIGGSVSANVHGRDPHEGPLIDSVESFRLMLADGRLIEVSRTENAELFPLVIGGYGLFGVILDVDLRLNDNDMVVERTNAVDVKSFPEAFRREVLGRPNVGLAIARLSTAPDTFMKEMYMTVYERTGEYVLPLPLTGERNVELTKFLFGLSRKYDWGKNVSWSLQKEVYSRKNGTTMTRNHAMRPEIEFLDYRDMHNTDLLQEYFVPFDQFAPFVERLGTLIKEERLNVVNITVRYVPRNEESLLSYAREDSLALVLLINHKRTPKHITQLERATQRMVDAAIEHRGTFYLTYQLFPTGEQVRRVYPEFEAFAAAKTRWDKEHLFMNEFYRRYAR